MSSICGRTKSECTAHATTRILAAACAALCMIMVCRTASAQSASLAIGYPVGVSVVDFMLSTSPYAGSTVTASPSSFDIHVVTTGTTSWMLTVETTGSYFDPATQDIPVSCVTWTASCDGIGTPDTALSTNPTTIESGTGSNTWDITVAYKMDNRWDFVDGTYDIGLTYTLTAV